MKQQNSRRLLRSCLPVKYVEAVYFSKLVSLVFATASLLSMTAT